MFAPLITCLLAPRLRGATSPTPFHNTTRGHPGKHNERHLLLPNYAAFGACRHAACNQGKQIFNRDPGKRRADSAPPLIADVSLEPAFFAVSEQYSMTLVAKGYCIYNNL